MFFFKLLTATNANANASTALKSHTRTTRNSTRTRTSLTTPRNEEKESPQIKTKRPNQPNNKKPHSEGKRKKSIRKATGFMHRKKGKKIISKEKKRLGQNSFPSPNGSKRGKKKKRQEKHKVPRLFVSSLTSPVLIGNACDRDKGKRERGSRIIAQCVYLHTDLQCCQSGNQRLQLSLL